MTYDEPNFFQERAPQKDKTVTLKRKNEKILVKYPIFGLDTKTYWLTDRQLQCGFDRGLWIVVVLLAGSVQHCSWTHFSCPFVQWPPLVCIFILHFRSNYNLNRPHTIHRNTVTKACPRKLELPELTAKQISLKYKIFFFQWLWDLSFPRMHMAEVVTPSCHQIAPAATVFTVSVNCLCSDDHTFWCNEGKMYAQLTNFSLNRL
jgi:hypothetical protein